MLCEVGIGQVEAFSKPEICSRLVAAQCGVLDRAHPSSYAAAVFAAHLSELKERKAEAFGAYLSGACDLPEGGHAMLKLLGQYSWRRGRRSTWPDCRAKLLHVYTERILGAPKRLPALAYQCFDALLASLSPEAPCSPLDTLLCKNH